MNPGRPKECGLEIVSGRHLPESWRGNLITSDFRANRVVRYRLTPSGSGYPSRLLGDVLASSHRSFRPVDVKMGPDGAIYVADWYSPIIDHGEVDFHHPLRDHRHGRIWRLTATGRSLVTPPAIAKATTETVLAALKLPEDWAREQARRILQERESDEVLPKLRAWIQELDPESENFEHHRLEALWVLQGLRSVDADWLREVLDSPEPRVRAAAVRVLGDWSASLPDASDRFAAAVRDEHPQVRLAAVNALRGIASRSGAGPTPLGGPECAELALKALDSPLDASLDYAVWRTARELERFWLPRLELGKPVFGGKPHRLAFALAAVGQQASLRPLVELLKKGAITGPERQEALELVASLGTPDDLAMVLETAVTRATADTAASQGLLEALLGGARRDRSAPRNAARVLELLASRDAAVVAAATRLAGHWKLEAGRLALEKLAADPASPRSLRHDAALALGKLDGGDELLTALAGADRPTAVRITATAARAALDPEAAAADAATLISAAKQAAEVEILFETFVGLRGGDELLASALREMDVEAPVAAAGIRIAGSSGRKMERLVAELTRAGSLRPITNMPPPEELSALLRAVAAEGDAARGEAIFRRDALRCTTCHALGGAGGHVGPDLSSLGGSSQTIHILESLLDPSAKIKEGFEPVVVFDRSGTVYSGTVMGKFPEGLRLRDVKDRIVTIPSDRIQVVSGSDVSIMPEGMTQTLRRDELVDLVRFLTELGRPGLFHVPTERFVRSWWKLEPTADASRALAERDAIATVAPTLNWTPIFSRTDGSLPLAELASFGGDGERCVRFTVDAETATTLRFEGLASAMLWVNGERRKLARNAVLAVEKGTHHCILLLRATTDSLRVELRER